MIISVRFRLWAVILLCTVAGLGPLARADGSGDGGWASSFHPYRVRLSLGRPIAGKVVIDLAPNVLLSKLAPVCVDQLSIDTFAFEKAVLINPNTGKPVGGFRLVPAGDVLPIDGGFTGMLAGKKQPWFPFGRPAKGKASRVSVAGASFDAMWINSKIIDNSGYAQKLSLNPAALYLLDYWVYADPYNVNLQIVDPAKRFYANEHHSYYPELTAAGRWTLQRVLYRPQVPDVWLKLTCGLGRAGIGGATLRKTAMVLIADLPTQVDALDLYCVMRAGHRLPQMTDELWLAKAPAKRVTVSNVKASAHRLNAAVSAIVDNGITAWHVSSDLPLKANVIARSKPAVADSPKPIDVMLYCGEAETVVIAIETGTERIRYLQTECNLPMQVRVEQLAEIPVYDGPFPDANLLERRFDALVPVNFDLAPPSSNGIHMLALTIKADHATSPKQTEGIVRLVVEDQTHRRAVLNLPIRVRVAPVIIKPAHHFGTQFAGMHWLVRYPKSEGYTRDSTTVAEFCGYSAKNMEPQTIIARVGELARKYFNRMIDFQVMPQLPTLHLPFKYDVIGQGPGRAPRLTNWHFEDYDIALDELVIGRDMPCFTIFHTDGYGMDKLRLIDGITYSLKSNAADPRWKQLPEDQFYNLVGDYFNALAQHLHDKGVLDRALFVIDESGPETFETIRRYVLAMKSRPMAKDILITHTMYKPSAWTHRRDNGRLLLDGIIDVSAPDNDDHFNRFEPELNARFTKVKRQWVYYVETDHLNLENAGISTAIAPLKLRAFGAQGWYCWASFIWSMPYPITERVGDKYRSGPVINPWINPFYHHGPGVLSFFYPPDPRGLVSKPTDRIIPSYRLALMRDGIELKALLDVIEAGKDDDGQPLCIDHTKLDNAKALLQELWAPNPVQWYLSYHHYRRAREQLFGAMMHKNKKGKVIANENND